jgi:pimeloyl-ACP methyl ester carboxylesterase
VRLKKKQLFLILSSGIVVLVIGYFGLLSQQETAELSDDIRAQAPGKFITLEKGTVHYTLQGSDSAELILFIHGGGIAGIEVWDKNIPFFTGKNYQVLAYDLYGRGYSDRVRVDYTPELFGNQLTQLLDSLKLQKRFNIVAMSMGAMIALDFAARQPERVNKIVFIDPSLTGDFKPSTLLKLPVINSILMSVYWYPNAAENQRKEFRDQELFNRYKERLKYFMNFSGYKYINYSTWMHMLNQKKIQLLDAVRPETVLLLYGEHDPYFPLNNIEVYQGHYPSLRHQMIRDAGHMPHLEKPLEVNNAIDSFFTD